MRHFTFAISVGLVLAGSVGPAGAAPTRVSVTAADGVPVGSRQIFSSSRLVVSWTSDESDPTHHFEVIARESVQGTEVRATVAAGTTSVTVSGLKAATSYAVTVVACGNDACAQSSASATATGTTDTEYWQLRGTGNSVSGLTKAVSDGNARLSATRLGPDADPVANHVQLYYGPMNANRQSPLAVAVASGPADAANPNSFLTFSSRAGSSGLISPPTPSSLITQVNTGQGVPIAKERGGFVRLFFEAQGADGRTRAMSIDSKDGFYGLDFNAGAAMTCSTAADYSRGGGCEPTVAIPVDGDLNGNSRINHSRQFKVAWPTLDSPHWDMATGSFMVFTSDRVTGCSEFQQNHGYAVWDGVKWVVQYRDNGCPKLFTSAQAAFPFHSGGARYRLYYGDPSITIGRGSSNLPFLGPKKLIYADGAVSGVPRVVDFEDWEPQTAARDVAFLWPDGTQMDARAEGYIDDYHFLTPTGDANLQVMYITITDGAIAPISVVALLRNP